MPTSEPPTSITVKVKVPPGYLATTNNDQFEVGSLPVTTTIGVLRRKIQECIPSNPPPERQRILFGGRNLADNEQTLADALNIKRDPEQKEYIIHLLIKAEGTATSRTPTPSGQHVNLPGGTAVPLMQQQQPNQPQMMQQQPQGLQQNTMNASMQQQHWQQHIRQHHAATHPHLLQHLQQHHQQAQGGQGFHVEGVGPDGQRFQIHQQTMHLPGLGMQTPGAGPGAMPGQLPIGMPMVPGPNGPVPLQPMYHFPPTGMPEPSPAVVQGRMEPMPPWPPQLPLLRRHGGQGPNDPTALDRARQHIAEMERLLAEIPSSDHITKAEDDRRTDDLMWRLERLREYIDPPGEDHIDDIRDSTVLEPSASSIPSDRQAPAQNGLPQPTMRPQGANIPPNFQNTAQPTTRPVQRPSPPTALDRQRQNMDDMHRLLDDIANTHDITPEERRRRVDQVLGLVRSFREYIDPFNVGTRTTAATTGSGEGRRSAPPTRPPNQQLLPQNGLPQPAMRPYGLPQPLHAQNMPPGLRFPSHPQNTTPVRYAHFQAPGMPPQQVQLPSNPNEVSAHLLSSPQGPQAIVFSPQHGTHIGSRIVQANGNGVTQRRPQREHTPRNFNAATAPAAPPPPPQEPPDPVAQAAGQLADQHAQLAAQAANGNVQDPLALQPFLNHFWMLVRILIFSYFLLGANLGWQRPIILLGIGLGFWAIRAGLLGDEGRVRRWWDGVVGLPPRQPQGAAAQREGDAAHAAPAAPQAQTQAQVQPQARAGGTAHRNTTMPTPEQVAQRLLNEQEARQQRQRNEQQHGLRELFRPIERAVALFIASLWPGIGEAHVREQRRLREEREEEERRRNILREEARRQEAEDRKRMAREGENQGQRVEGAVEGNGRAEEVKEGSTGDAGQS